MYSTAFAVILNMYCIIFFVSFVMKMVAYFCQGVEMSGDIDAEMQDKEEDEEEDQEGSDEEDKGEEDNLDTQAGKASFCYPIRLVYV